jgi:hypothetical protein
MNLQIVAGGPKPLNSDYSSALAGAPPLGGLKLIEAG